MKRVVCLSYLLLMAVGLQAHDHHEQEESFASSIFDSRKDPGPQSLPIPRFPNFAAITETGAHANKGIQDGDDVRKTGDGITLMDKGDYEVDFAVALVDLDTDEDPDEVNIYLLKNGDFDLDDDNPIVTSNSYFPGLVKTVTAHGLLKDVEPNTELALWLTTPDFDGTPALVLGWKIDARKIDHHKRHHDEDNR